MIYIRGPGFAWLSFQGFQRAPRHRLKEFPRSSKGVPKEFQRSSNIQWNQWLFKLQPAPWAHGAMFKYSCSSPSSITTASETWADGIWASPTIQRTSGKGVVLSRTLQNLFDFSMCQVLLSNLCINQCWDSLSLCLCLCHQIRLFQFKIFWGKNHGISR